MPEIKHSILLVLVVHSFLKFNRTFWFFLPFSNLFCLGQTGHTTGREVARWLVHWNPWGEPPPPPLTRPWIVRFRFQSSLCSLHCVLEQDTFTLKSRCINGCLKFIVGGNLAMDLLTWAGSHCSKGG